MAGEVDQYLMKKFREGLLNYKTSTGSKGPLYNEFEAIQNALDSQPEFQIRERLYCLNDLLTECQMQSKRNFRIRDPIKSKLSKINEELKKSSDSNVTNVSAQPNGQEATSRRRENEVRPWSSPSVDESKVRGFGDDVMSLEKVLVRQGISDNEDRFKAIGITGIAGIGKTALCQLLFNRKEVKKYFFPRIWVCMSTEPDEREDKKVVILKRMLVNLGVEEEIINKAYEGNKLKELLYVLQLQLQGKRYLIVFDGAKVETSEPDFQKWYGQLNSSPNHYREGEWDRLAYGLPKGCGGAVIVTSRSEKLVKTMIDEEGKGIAHRYRVQPLDLDFCWHIFEDAAHEGSEQFPPSADTEILKKEIFKRCAGVPLTAQMLGKSMAKKLAEEGGAANDSQQVQLAEGGGAANDSQQVQLAEEGGAANDSQQVQLAEGGGAANDSQQVQLAEEGGAANDSHHQQLAGGGGAANDSQQVQLAGGGGAANDSQQVQLAEEGGAANDSHHQHVPDDAASNGSEP